MTEIDKDDDITDHARGALDNNEVTLRVGDVDQKEGGCWRESIRNGRGYFPSSHVKQLRLSDIIFQADRNCCVVFDYEPCQKDELSLRVGDKVQVIGEVELGWWRGIIGDKVGVFPASHIRVSSDSLNRNKTSPDKGKKNVEGEVSHIDSQSPVQLRRNSSKFHPLHLTKNMEDSSKDIAPISSNLFDPEDEPLGPLYDTKISSGINTDTKSYSASVSESKSRGIISRLRHSFGAKPNLPKFFKRRSSFGSFMETQSTCSPAATRRNSFVNFFRRGSSCSVRLCDEVNNDRKDGILSRFSRSLDTAMPANMSAVSSPVVDILHYELRNVRLPGGRTTEQSDSWVWEGNEINMMRQKTSKSRRDFSSEDSGYVENDTDVGVEPFGPVAEVTEEVFKDMFSSHKTNSQVDGGLNLDKIEAVDNTIPVQTVSKQRSKIITSAGKLSSTRCIGKRSFITTNPYFSWRRSASTVSEEITEI